jgi:Ca2+/Na+ antiporter
MLFVVVYFMVEFIVEVLNVFCVQTEISHFVVGLTLMVWGSDNMETISLAISMGRGEEELATIAVLSCQIICLTLVVPVACMVRMLKLRTTRIQVLLPEHDRYQLLVPIFIIVSVAFTSYLLAEMHLNRKCCLLFAALYAAYLGYIWS